MDIINQVFAGVTVIAIASMAGVMMRFFKILMAIKGSQQAQLRDDMLRAYRYYKTQDGISLDDKANFSNMYRWYHALGQNGMMTHIYNEVLDMPTKGGDDHDAG